MNMHFTPRYKQGGIALLEGLIAILIFSLGILAIVGMQSMAVKQVTDARYRSEAAMLANQLFGAMWVSNRAAAQLKARFDSDTNGAAGYTAWRDTVASTLPGVADNPPSVTVNADGDDNDGLVTVTIRWLAPNEALLSDGSRAQPHTYVAIAKIR